MKIKYGMFILILISLLALSSCKAKETISETAIPEGSSEGYPAPESTVSVEKAVTDPGYPPPAKGPVRENASLMQVEILTLTLSEKSPDLMVAHVRVNTTAAAEGFDQYNPNLAGQEIDILLAAGDAAGLTAGDIINLTVSYRGDEWGGGYYGSSITLEN